MVLLPGLSKDEAMRATLRLRDDLRNCRFLEGAGLSLQLSGSFGLATYPEDGSTVSTILRAADTMMYEAKVTRDAAAVAGRGMVAGVGPEQNRLGPPEVRGDGYGRSGEPPIAS